MLTHTPNNLPELSSVSVPSTHIRSRRNRRPLPRRPRSRARLSSQFGGGQAARNAGPSYPKALITGPDAPATAGTANSKHRNQKDSFEMTGN